MQADRRKLTVLVLVLLAALAATGGAVAWSRYSPGQPIEITLAPEAATSGTAYLGGAVNLPGYYPLRPDDTVQGLIRDAGGLAPDANRAIVEVRVPSETSQIEPQKVDLNRAEAWLLEALPGIGETRAQAIIEYRLANGGFRNTAELSLVKGIGPALFEQIKDRVTIGH